MNSTLRRMLHTTLRGITKFLPLIALLWSNTTAIRADQIAFFYALDADFSALAKGGTTLGQSVSVGTRSIHRLRLGPHTVCAVKMGSGCIETATSAQALLARFRCDRAYSLGPAGALRTNLHTGSWYAVQRITGWQRGSLDATGLKLAPDALLTLLPEPLETATVNEPGSTAPLHIASGDSFVAAASEGSRVRDLTGADAVDMNLYGLALVCRDHNVPLTAWKVISDRADEQASESFRVFLESYDGIGGAQLANLILHLPPQPNDPLTYPAIEKALRAE